MKRPDTGLPRINFLFSHKEKLEGPRNRVPPEPLESVSVFQKAFRLDCGAIDIVMDDRKRQRLLGNGESTGNHVGPQQGFRELTPRQKLENAPANSDEIVCDKNVVLIAMNRGKMRTKGEQRRRKGFIGFSRNLLISFD